MNCFSQLLKRPSCIAVNEIYEFDSQDSTQEMRTMTKVIQTFHEQVWWTYHKQESKTKNSLP